MYRCILLFSFVLALSFSNSSAQPKVDTTFIQRFSNRLVIAPYISSSTNTLVFKSWNTPIDSSQNVRYQPNLRGGFGLSFSYHIIDFSIGFRQKMSEESEKLYGKSSSFALDFRIWANKKILTEFNFQRVTGYANISTPFYDTLNFPKNYPFEHRGDISVNMLKLRSVYLFNPDKFSYRSSFGFSERQLKSAVGFLLSAQAYTEVAYADSAFIPQLLSQQYGNASGIHQVAIAALGLAPGIGGTWTKGRWFLTSILFVGADLQHFSYDEPGTKNFKSERKITANADFRFSFGYNADKLFFGFQLTSDHNLLRPSPFKINSNFTRSYLTLGYRFNSPKILDKSYDAAVNTIIPKKLRKFMY